MKLDFRIDWGYQYLYSRRHYHPFFLWDGEIGCTGGEIAEIRLLDYPILWYGPGHCARETRLPGPHWESRTRRGLAGIRVIADAGDAAVFHLHTRSGDFDFSADELRKRGRIAFSVGPKYLGCHVTVTLNGFLWFRPAPQAGELAWEADDLPLPRRDWARMRTAWLAPGEAVEFTADIPEVQANFVENILHLVAMAAPAYTPGDEKQVHDFFPIELSCDGKEVARTSRYFREHDNFMQMLEDVWIRFSANAGRHVLKIRNGHERFFLLFSRITLRQSAHRHLELSLPPWALTGESLTGRIFAVRSDRTIVHWPGGKIELALQFGWNEFEFSFSEPGVDVAVQTKQSSGVIPAVYAIADETPEVTVGYDMTTVPHDGTGLMDWLLDYTWRTRLGNLVVFRSFRWKSPFSYQPVPVEPEFLARWGEILWKHHITVEAANCFCDGSLVKAAGNALHSIGFHEYPGPVYARDPEPPWSSVDMREAARHYIDYLKPETDRVHAIAPRAAFGDASGGHRYCYLAGADFIRSETMVAHTQHLCSQARPAAEALGSGEWGVHIAIQHGVQPYFESHLGVYFLSLFQPWMMGASMIYEEDSLFLLFKEERQSWDDALTKGKRDMTREFYRFVKTHPRTGRNRRRIAFLEGRYAAPFNGFICGPEQTPDYPVWGWFGNTAPAWKHGQPEKCRQLLDVLMPGASTHPLRQRYDRRRFYFSGTPYGDFDEVPVEAPDAYFRQYSLLLNLGWNTMIEEDYEKLYRFVENGGTLFTGLPQFSTHVKRDFLDDWKDLALWNGGELSRFCGVKVRGPGDSFHGQWNAADRETFPEPELSGIPNRSPDEDGPCRLADIELRGAEIAAWDADSGAPLIVRNRVGKGEVFLLTAWAYPGHEQLREPVASWVAKLAEAHRGEIYVDDPSREVFWTLWEEKNGCARLMLLNTDWTERGNKKDVWIHTPDYSFCTKVLERSSLILTLLSFAALEPDPDVHVEITAINRHSAGIRLHGTGVRNLIVYRKNGETERLTLDLQAHGTVFELELNDEENC